MIMICHFMISLAFVDECCSVSAICVCYTSLIFIRYCCIAVEQIHILTSEKLHAETCMYSVLTIDIFSLHRQPAGASAQRTTKRSTCHGLKVEWDTVHAVGAYVADPSDVEPSSCQSHRPSFAGIVKEAASKIIVCSCLQRALYVFVVFCRRYSSSDGLVPYAAIEIVFVHTYTRRLHTMYGL